MTPQISHPHKQQEQMTSICIRTLQSQKHDMTSFLLLWNTYALLITIHRIPLQDWDSLIKWLMPWQITQQHKGCFSFWIMSAETKSPLGINACQHKGIVLNNGAESKQSKNFCNFIAKKYHDAKIWLVYMYTNTEKKACTQTDFLNLCFNVHFAAGFITSITMLSLLILPTFYYFSVIK